MNGSNGFKSLSVHPREEENLTFKEDLEENQTHMCLRMTGKGYR